MKTIIQPEKNKRHIFLRQGIVYSKQPVKDGTVRDLHLSLLTPVGHRTKDANAYPCVVWVCGGGWRGGRERHAEMLPELNYVAEAGYIVAAVEYRVIGEAVFPAQINDVLTAVRYLKSHAEEYHIDSERIGIMGSSAGGHLTLLAANNDGQFDTTEYSEADSTVRCAVDFYGIADIERIFAFNVNALKNGTARRVQDPSQFGESLLLGDLPVNIPETARKAGPVNGISEKTCPVLVMHGDDDHVVNIEQSELYYEAMKNMGRDIPYYVLHGADHGSDEFFQVEVQDIVLAFLQENL